MKQIKINEIVPGMKFRQEHNPVIFEADSWDEPNVWLKTYFKYSNGEIDSCDWNFHYSDNDDCLKLFLVE